MATKNFAATGGVEVSDDVFTSGYELLPVGTVIMYVGSIEPEGWIFCDGRSIAKDNTTYANLKVFLEANSYPYGSNVSDFFIPDFRSRVPLGYSATSVGGLSTRDLGASGGSESHLVMTTNLPPHTHTLGGHTHSGTTGNQSANHAHGTLSGSLNNISANHTHNLLDHTHNWQYFVNADSGVSKHVIRESNTDGTLRAGWLFAGAGGPTSNESAFHTHTTVANVTVNTIGTHTHSFATGGPSENLSGDGGLAATPNFVDHMGSFLALNFIIKY